MSDINDLRQVFNSIKANKTDVAISTEYFIELIASLLDDKMVASTTTGQLIHLFDPFGLGQVTFDTFRSGIETLKADQEQSVARNSPVESANSSRFVSTTASTTTTTNSIADRPAIHFDNTTHFYEKGAVKITVLPTPSATVVSDSDNMSAVDSKSSNNTSINYSQSEELFEFTPTNDDSPDEMKKADDGIEDDYSYSNGDSLFNSLKPTYPQRNTWMTSSLKRHSRRSNTSGPYNSTPNSNFRNSPTNGSSSLSRRSSISYESDEMNNDPTSLEDYVQNLTDKIKKLQEQIQILSEGQVNNEEKYSNMKKENSNLHNKINFLEEQIRDIEVHSETKRKEDEVRFQESMARIEREKLQELEKCINKICSLQREIEAANAEIKRHLLTIDRLQYVKDQLEDQIQDKNGEIESLKNEVNKLKEVIRVQNEESNANSSIIAALNNELSIRKPSDSSESKAYQTTEQDEMMNSISNEFEQQMRFLKEENRSLKEANEELTAQLLNNHLIEGKSLLKEGEAVSSLANEISDLNNEQLKSTLKEQQDVNAKLRAYIDGILLNIVENYPQLLEVKSR